MNFPQAQCVPLQPAQMRCVPSLVHPPHTLLRVLETVDQKSGRSGNHTNCSIHVSSHAFCIVATTSIPRPPSTYDGPNHNQITNLLPAISNASSTLTTIPDSGIGISNFPSFHGINLITTARSITEELFRIFTPFFSRSARFNGVCPPLWKLLQPVFFLINTKYIFQCKWFKNTTCQMYRNLL